MTTTSIINQAFQSSPIAPAKRSLATETNMVAFNISFTNGVTVPAPHDTYIRYAVSSFDIPEADAPVSLLAQSKLLRIPSGGVASKDVIAQTEPELALGSILYYWSETPRLSHNGILKVDLVEI